MNIVRGFYWDRIAQVIISPLVIIACVVLFIHYIPPIVAEEIAKQEEYVRIHEEAKKQRELKIFEKQIAQRAIEVDKWKKEQSKAKEIKNVNENTVKYQTIITKEIFPIGTYVYSEEFGAGKINKITGLEVSTKEGWNFNYGDVCDGKYKIKLLSYKEYKKLRR